jgi:hypothetical protein
MSKITKALFAALALTGVSIAVTANASAVPYRDGWYQGSSDAYQAPRHDPTNTNGFLISYNALEQDMKNTRTVLSIVLTLLATLVAPASVRRTNRVENGAPSV